MNTPLRRVAVAVMVMTVALLLNATYVQVIKADDLRADPRNSRVLLDEYSRQRGQISGGGTVLASSTPTDDRYKYLRTYPNMPEAYAPITGFYSMQYGMTGLELAEDPILSGNDSQLFGTRLVDMFAGRDPRGGNVLTTIDPVMQETAYQELTSKGYTGSVVAIEPSTGRILSMVSTPSYDPNVLAQHDNTTSREAWQQLNADPGKPMVNRATAQTYPPGSTFKTIVTAAALSNSVATPDSQFTAAPNIQLPNSSATLENYGGSACGSGRTASLYDAFRRSCNTAFVELGISVGSDGLKDEAAAFGIGTHGDTPVPVADSTVGPIPDDAALGQSSIGQRDVAVTPLDNAVIAATIANGGVRMQPYLVDQTQEPDLSELEANHPVSVGQAVSAQVASTLTDLMIASEEYTAGAGGSSYQIASKTGTAEHGSDPRNTTPHAWYMAFAPAKNPKIAIAVLVEGEGDRNLAATGGSVAAPIARAVLDAGLEGG